MTKLLDELTGALIGVARATDGAVPSERTYRALMEGLVLTGPEGEGDEDALRRQIEVLRREKAVLAPQCSGCAAPCGRRADGDMEKIRQEGEDTRALKALILLCLRGMADEVLRSGGAADPCFCEGLFAVGEELDRQQLLAVIERIAGARLGQIERKN